MRGTVLKLPYILLAGLFPKWVLDKLEITNANAFYQQLLKWLRIPMAEYVYLLLEYNITILLERKVVSYMKTISGQMFIDIGAYAGYYTRKLATNFKWVLAFEPDPSNWNILTRKTSSLKNVVRWNRAVYIDTSYHKLFIRNVSSLRSLKIHHSDEFIEVGTVALNDLITEPIDLIKVDVEFSEFDILKGALDVVKYIKRWVIEIHEVPRKKELEDLLKFLGYRTRWLDELHILGERIC